MALFRILYTKNGTYTPTQDGSLIAATTPLEALRSYFKDQLGYTGTKANPQSREYTIRESKSDFARAESSTGEYKAVSIEPSP